NRPAAQTRSDEPWRGIRHPYFTPGDTGGSIEDAATNALFEKIKEIEREISDEVGGLVLFGLFKPEETPYWDVVVSADWVDPQSSPAIAYVVGKLQQWLSREQ